MKKSVLVTGANHGLGLSLLKIFLSNDYTVFAGIYDKVPTEEIDDFILHEKSSDKNLYIFKLDVTDDISVKNALESVSEVTDSLSVIINNAAILCDDSYYRKNETIFGEIDFDSVLKTYDVNAVGALRVANAFSEMLISSDDKLLINISSDAGSISCCCNNSWFGYCMSKAALNMAGMIISNSYKDRGGKVWQIHPGWMQTYMHGKMSAEADITPEYSAKRIFELIQNADNYGESTICYMDLHGNKMSW